MALDSRCRCTGAVSLPLLWMNMHAYQQQRVLTFWILNRIHWVRVGTSFNPRRRSVQAASSGKVGKPAVRLNWIFCRKVTRIYHRGAGRRAGYVGCCHSAGAVSVRDRTLLDLSQSSRNDLGAFIVRCPDADLFCLYLRQYWDGERHLARGGCPTTPI